MYSQQCIVTLLFKRAGTRTAVHAEVVRLEEELAILTDRNSKLEDELSTLENRKYCSRLGVIIDVIIIIIIFINFRINA